MSRLIRLDSRGHGTLAEWSKDNKEEIEKAKAIFVEQQKHGFTMFGSHGEGVLKKFDPEVEEMIAVPQLRGG